MNFTDKQFKLITIAIIFLFALFPLFIPLPFRIHLDLPWEGTYRLYQGQIPYKDFGMPLGLGFFIVPLVCFYIFGPVLKSLLIAQSIITIVSALTFRKILIKLKLPEYKVAISTILFCVSYTFIYFWPWYNNTAFTFQLISILMLLIAFEKTHLKSKTIYYLLAALFTFLTFFTKQDYGGLAFLFNVVLCICHAYYNKKYIDPVQFIGSFAIITLLIILPLLKTDFGYWFNYGQPPHESRLSIFKILDEIFLGSTWEKFYLLVVFVNLYVIVFFEKKIPDFNQALLHLIVIGILCEALITKTTSGNATGNTTYYHAFGIAFILSLISANYFKPNISFLVWVLLLSFIWFSGDYWKYLNRIFPKSDSKNSTITQKTDSSKTQIQANWINSGIPVFNNIKLPDLTINGIKESKILFDSVKSKEPIVLNMSELTMLAYDWNYKPLTGLPLWYHVGVGIFPKQIDEINKNIVQKTYDMVLFEEIPQLDNFFPSVCYNQLCIHYKLKKKFLAPRKENDSFIYVFTRK